MMPKHARTDNNESRDDSQQEKTIEEVVVVESSSAQNSSQGQSFVDSAQVDAQKGKKNKKNLTPRQKKSRRMRRILIAVVVLLIALIGVLGYFTYLLFEESQNLATQQAQLQNMQNVDDLQEEDSLDTATEVTKKTDVPLLLGLLGRTENDALETIGHGATVSSSISINEEGNPIKDKLSVALTDEPSDTRSGTPTVYLGLDKDGKVVMAGYSAATASLGYGSLSFSDAVSNERIIEKTLNEAGLNVAEGAAELPEDKEEYSTYASDGTTLVKENYSFKGTAEVDGKSYDWSAVLVYDYALANSSGNLADTSRRIYVYINAPT